MRQTIKRLMPDLTRRIYTFNQYERNRWIAAQATQIPEGFRVLDVGAGNCPYRALFAHCEYKAHDFIQLESNQLLGKEGYGTIDIISDILSIPVPDASFDVILCTEVLEHVPEPIKSVREFARIIKPGGRLLLTAPLGSGLHQEPFHFYGGFTPHFFRKFLKENGFEKITIEPNGGFFKHYGQESLRFAALLTPRRAKQFVWLGIWLLSLPWVIIIFPLIGHLIDSWEKDKAFTVGYHVSAIRSS